MQMQNNKYQILLTILLTSLGANAISNTNFNADIRDYSVKEKVKEDISNFSNVKTLQKEDVGTYTSFAPDLNAVRFKEIPDSALSSSSYSKGLLQHEHPGYIINDYEETPHYNYGYDYQLHEDLRPYDYKHHHDPNEYKHHYDHHDTGHNYYSNHHPVDHGYHHKHYNHGLAAKKILWPIAGIALLGAAAALVSNPVLLQLGVVSGRRRRDTEYAFSAENIPEFKKYPKKFKYYNADSDDNPDGRDKFKKRMLKWSAIKKLKHDVLNKVQLRAETNTKTNIEKLSSYGDDSLIPVPLIIKGN